MFQEKKINLTPRENVDNRFEQCTPYVFAAAGFIEEKQMQRNIGVSFSKGKINVSDEK